MSAVEEIRAAIERLTELKTEATSGAWGSYVNILGVTRVVDSELYVVAETYDARSREEEAAANAELIATLHATIAAQLSVLRAASVDEDEAREHWASVGKPHLRGPAKIVPINMAALDLARAINGGTK